MSLSESGRSLGIFPEQLRCSFRGKWLMWCFPPNCYQILVMVNTAQPSVTFMAKLNTAAPRPNQCAFVWISLGYKHRWPSNGMMQHVCFCVLDCYCACTVQFVHVRTLACPRTCVLVSFYEGRSRSPPRLCLMIKAAAVPLLLLMLRHNRACWGFDFFIHSSQ